MELVTMFLLLVTLGIVVLAAQIYGAVLAAKSKEWVWFVMAIIFPTTGIFYIFKHKYDLHWAHVFWFVPALVIVVFVLIVIIMSTTFHSSLGYDDLDYLANVTSMT